MRALLISRNDVTLARDILQVSIIVRLLLVMMMLLLMLMLMLMLMLKTLIMMVILRMLVVAAMNDESFHVGDEADSQFSREMRFLPLQEYSSKKC